MLSLQKKVSRKEEKEEDWTIRKDNLVSKVKDEAQILL